MEEEKRVVPGSSASSASSAVVTSTIAIESSSSSSDWLFVSRRLDLVSLPSHPLFAAPVILLGDRPHYRLTPAVVAWVERMGAVLDERVRAGQLPADQLAEYTTALHAVWRFADAVFAAADLHAARSAAAPLPAVPWLPDGSFPAVLSASAAPPRPRPVSLPTPAGVAPRPKPRHNGRRKAAGGEKFVADAGGLFAARPE